MMRLSETTGGAVTNMEPGKVGTRTYFDVDDIDAGVARVRELGGESGEKMPVPEHGLVRRLQGPARQRLRDLADGRANAPTPEG